MSATAATVRRTRRGDGDPAAGSGAGDGPDRRAAARQSQRPSSRSGYSRGLSRCRRASSRRYGPRCWGSTRTSGGSCSRRSGGGSLGIIWEIRRDGHRTRLDRVLDEIARAEEAEALRNAGGVSRLTPALTICIIHHRVGTGRHATVAAVGPDAGSRARGQQKVRFTLKARRELAGLGLGLDHQDAVEVLANLTAEDSHRRDGCVREAGAPNRLRGGVVPRGG